MGFLRRRPTPLCPTPLCLTPLSWSRKRYMRSCESFNSVEGVIFCSLVLTPVDLCLLHLQSVFSCCTEGCDHNFTCCISRTNGPGCGYNFIHPAVALSRRFSM